MLTSVQAESTRFPLSLRNQELCDGISGVSPYPQPLGYRLCYLGYTMNLYEPEHPNILPRPFSFALRFSLQTTVEDLEALGKLDVGQGQRMIK